MFRDSDEPMALRWWNEDLDLIPERPIGPWRWLQASWSWTDEEILAPRLDPKEVEE